jgi:hypothetical protein
LRLVLEIVVVDRFGPSEVVDANDQWAEVLKRANGSEMDKRESHSDERDQNESDFQIGVRHHRVTIGFEIQTLGVLE